MKTMLLRVGIDKGSGGCLAPIFNDGSFEYIPIPDGSGTTESRTFESLPYRSDFAPDDYLPKRLHDVHPHYDPEFESYTYGDPTKNKREQLKKLESGDRLVFYAGLSPTPETYRTQERLYIIGYFTIDKILDFNNITGKDREQLKQQYSNNAHFKRDEIRWNDLVIAVGDPQDSKLLDTAIPFSDADYEPLSPLQRELDYDKDLTRAIGRTFQEPKSKRLSEWIDDFPSPLLGSEASAYSYVVRSDSGFAPNVRGGIMSLACCKPKIRAQADVGDWIIGTHSTTKGDGLLAFVMQVSEAISFSEFYQDERFQNKKPLSENSQGDADGDNIYKPTDQGLVQLENNHHDESHREKDIGQTERVLLSDIFWYFGNEAPPLPKGLNPELIKSGQGYKTKKPTQLLPELVGWLHDNFRIGSHGKPSDQKNPLHKEDRGDC